MHPLYPLQRSLVEPWVLPIIQGYVETRTLVVHSNNPPDVLQTHPSGRTSARWKRGTSRQSCSESGAGEEGEEVEMMEFEGKKTKPCTGTCIIHAALPYIYVVQCLPLPYSSIQSTDVSTGG